MSAEILAFERNRLLPSPAEFTRVFTALSRGGQDWILELATTLLDIELRDKKQTVKGGKR